jgi:hypothetical protein
MTVKQLAKEIKQSPDYSKDKPVRLYLCEAGMGENSHAERLSKLLPNRIIASTNDTTAHVELDPKDKVTFSPEPHPMPGGQWIEWEKGQRQAQRPGKKEPQ